MKIFVCLATLLVVTTAKPSSFAFAPIPLANAGFYAASPLQTQFHAQDNLGQYSYGYSDGLSRKEEIKSLDGVTRGSYSYVDAEGKLQTVDYTADSNGFRAAGTNLPKALPEANLVQPTPVSETIEVSQAKAAHLAAVEQAKELSSQSAELVAVRTANIPNMPQPVADTPEVAQAKAQHFAAKKEAELRNLPTSGNIEYAPVVQAARLAPVPLITSLRTNGIPMSYSYGIGSPFTSPFAWNSRFFSGHVVV